MALHKLQLNKNGMSCQSVRLSICMAQAINKGWMGNKEDGVRTPAWSGDGNIEPPGVSHKTQLAFSIAPHGGHHNHISLPALHDAQSKSCYPDKGKDQPAGQ